MIPRLRTLLLVGVAIIVSGCAAPQVNGFTAFARAGSGYAIAVDQLLTKTGIEQIDATSWTLIAEKQLKNIDSKTYYNKNNDDLAYIKQIVLLRQQSKLLGQYFSLLDGLSSAGSPEQSQKAIEDVVVGLTKLRESMAHPVIASPMTQVFGDYTLQNALKSELNTRKDVIRESLIVHEQLLKKLAAQLEHILRLSGSIKEETLIVMPITADSPLKNPAEWVTTRRAVVMRSATIDELNIAAQTIVKLRETFESLVAGNSTPGQISFLMTDIEILLAISSRK